MEQATRTINDETYNNMTFLVTGGVDPVTGKAYPFTSNQNSEKESLVTAQELTGAETDLGSEIDVRGKTHVGIYIDADVNDSADVNLTVYGRHTSGGDNYEIDGITTISLWTTAGGSDFKKYYELDVGTLPYIILRVVAGTVGATAGDLSVVIDKKSRG